MRTTARHLLVLAAAFGLAGPALAAAPAADPAALSHARAIAAAVMPVAQRPEIVRRLVDSLMAPMRAALAGSASDPGLKQLVEGHFARLADRLRPIAEQQIPIVMEATAQAYHRAYSPAELGQVAAFAQTPAGARFLSNGAAIATDPALISANQAFMAEAAIIGRSSGEELRVAVADYLAKHPEVAQKIQQARQQQQQAQQPPAKRP